MKLKLLTIITLLYLNLICAQSPQSLFDAITTNNKTPGNHIQGLIKIQRLQKMKQIKKEETLDSHRVMQRIKAS